MTTLANRKTRLVFTTADEIRERGKYRVDEVLQEVA